MKEAQKENAAHPQQRSHRIRDFLIYIGVGVSVAILAISLGIAQAKSGDRSAPDLLKWVGFSVMTLLIFSWGLRQYHTFWKTRKFWKLITAFAAIHLIFGIGLLSRTTITSLFPFMLVTPLEYFLLDTFLSKFLIS